jgi:GH15 family glucan-1,4-alpha-glucosidase
LPCYDYWEEFGDRQHTSTLAAITAGLRAAAALTGVDRYARAADDVWSFVLAQCLAEGHFIKGPEDRRVDASLLSLAVPFGLVEVGDERFASTVRRIEAELAAPSGGVWRYLGDTYYGGGAWVLLTCWLAWAQLEAGNTSKASAGLQWVRHWASVDGQLPEQVTDGGHVQQPAWRQPWVDKWGQPANPLLWSQAMYVLLDDALGRARQGGAA